MLIFKESCRGQLGEVIIGPWELNALMLAVFYHEAL